MSTKTVILLSSVHWHATWQRHHHLAVGLRRRGYRVFFVEPLPKRWPAITEFPRLIGRLLGQRRLAGTCLQKESADIKIFSPRFLPDVNWITRRVNNFFFLPRFERQLRVATGDSVLIMIHYLPLMVAIDLQTRLQPQLAIYDCVSDWSVDPYVQGLDSIEKMLIKKVDMVLIADSTHNFDRLAGSHPQVVQIENGVDVDHFRSAASTERAVHKLPRCAYFGNIGISLDIDLLRSISHHYPLRLIGPVRTSLAGFSDRTEILGAVPYEEIPRHLLDVDVLLLPYRLSLHNKGVFPVKTFECLATGKPTIVTGLQSLSRYQDLFYFCTTENECLNAIAKAVSEDPDLGVRRFKVAKENSWDKRIAEIDARLAGLLKAKFPERLDVDRNP